MMSANITVVSHYSRYHFTALDLITGVMILNINMFGAAVIDRVLRHLDARLVTDHEIGSVLVGTRQNFA